MKCLTLLALLILATLAFVQAGKVSIKGECINCNNHPTTTTRKPSSARGNGGRTTAKPKPKAKAQPARKASDSDEDDDLSGGWSLHQSADGAQHIASRRHKRQWSQVLTGWDGNIQDAGSWSGNIDSRGRPDTVIRNSDCVGCNIRG